MEPDFETFFWLCPVWCSFLGADVKCVRQSLSVAMAFFRKRGLTAFKC